MKLMENENNYNGKSHNFDLLKGKRKQLNDYNGI
jgi:hypothetical protein